MTRRTENALIFVFCPLSSTFPTKFDVENITYQSSYQHYEASKALEFNDYELWHNIVAGNQATSHQIAKLSRTVRNFIPAQWNNKATDCMRVSLQYKFWGNSLARDYLLDTGNLSLIYANADEPFWGTGLDFPNPLNENMACWKGYNNLGILLEQLRDDMRFYYQQKELKDTMAVF